MLSTPQARHGARSSLLSGAVATLFPGNFAMVMATGIVCITARLHAILVIPDVLFAINLIAFAILWVMTFARLIRFPALLLQDLIDRGKGATFLTKVAATSILGSQIAALTPFAGLSAVIWLGAILLWTILIYIFFMAMTVGESKSVLEESLNGTWPLTVVSTQSLCVLGVFLAQLLLIVLRNQILLLTFAFVSSCWGVCSMSFSFQSSFIARCFLMYNLRAWSHHIGSTWVRQRSRRSPAQN